jgi:hypothetical protein
MKVKTIIITILAVSTAVLLMWYSYSTHGHGTKGGEGAVNDISNSLDTKSNRIGKIGSLIRHSTNPAGSGNGSAQGSASFDTNVEQQMPPQLSFDSPITFYGKAVDESNAPLSGVAVHFGWNDPSPAHWAETNTVTDTSGMFSLNSVHGKALEVKLQKAGYYYSMKQNPMVFEFSDSYADNYYRPDVSNPIIFHLRRKGRPASLIRGKKDVLVSRDGTPVQVDLSTGKKVTTGNGDLLVQYHRTDGRNYDWNCVIEVLGGGLLESPDEATFIAPDSGYRPSDEINMKQSPDWQSNATRNYFLKLRNGNYARLQFRMMTGTSDFFHIEYFLNPSGSQNLEFDSNQGDQ